MFFKRSHKKIVEEEVVIQKTMLDVAIERLCQLGVKSKSTMIVDTCSTSLKSRFSSIYGDRYVAFDSFEDSVIGYIAGLSMVDHSPIVLCDSQFLLDHWGKIQRLIVAPNLNVSFVCFDDDLKENILNSAMKIMSPTSLIELEKVIDGFLNSYGSGFVSVRELQAAS
jgi:transketolase C-terminal domain/subunit